MLVLATAACTAQRPEPSLPVPAETAHLTARLDVPAGYAPLSVEFADARRGYALFVRCGGERCEARLFGTEDGGRSWRARTHPRPQAKNHQIYVGGGPVVVLLAEPHAWYVSRTGAATWQSRPYDASGVPPADYHSADGQFYLDCPEKGGCAFRDWTAPDWHQDVPADLDSARSLTNGRDGRLWLAGVDGGRAVTAYGKSAGHFTPLAVPEQPGGTIWNARVATSADGRDVWLVADQEQASSGGQGGGRLAVRHAAARKGTGLPLIWQLQGGSWVPRPITGITQERRMPYAVAPAGGGLLAITGPDVSGYLDGGAYIPSPGMPRLDWVGQLPDGTLYGRDNQPGMTYLSTGTGARRTWTAVKVTA
ncbi:hypothetical protein Prum_085090 [Phytohabitans rumicis]|uniref:Exo-alpha-sialidase n=1 Tax=Phytohabitans rumicis TaxID=1076125 RepID=A0A6V8LLC2_9ACTN|nr:hypothetical protein Prum_085090 [Phytohabitans rumicis]